MRKPRPRKGLTSEANRPRPAGFLRPARPKRWVLDWLNPGQYCGHAVGEEHFRGKSEHQDIEVVDLDGFGRALILDGEIQSVEADEHIYHECLAHPPLLLCERAPRRVLVLGGGEGATLREVLRHTSVEQAVMVDLDPEVVEAARRHLPSFHAGSFDDPRVELVFGDAREYVEEAGDPFDAIIVDLTNPHEGGPATRLFTVEFYRALRNRLAAGGLVALQSGSANPSAIALMGTVFRSLGEVFPHVDTGVVYLPSFLISWSFMVAGASASGALDLDAAEIDDRLRQRIEGGIEREPAYYDGPSHLRMFHLPRYIREALGKEGSVSRDGSAYELAVPGSRSTP